MGYPLDLALRYLGSKKRAFISVGTFFAVLGVAIGVGSLATVMAITGGFQAQFREKVLGVNAHVLVLKYSTDFREYRSIMDQVANEPGVAGVAPFSINPMMLTHGDATATGVLLKGVDPAKSLGVGEPPGTRPVLILPQQIVGCEDVLLKEGVEAANACGQAKLGGLRLPGAKPAERRVLEMRPMGIDEPRDAFDAGAPPADPNDPDGLIRAIEADLKRREAQRAATAAGKPDPDAAVTPPKPGDRAPKLEDAGAPHGGAVPAATSSAAAAPAPYGEVKPTGGYKSKLPDPDDAVLPPDIDPDPCSNPAKVSELPGIVIGVSLAKTLGVAIGDCVTVTSPTIGYSFSGGSLKPPVARRYRVIALFRAGFDQYDSKLVYTDLYEAQNFYDQGDTVTGVEMIVNDVDKAPQIARHIGESLGSGLYHTMDWEELNHGLFTALKIQQIGMSIVLALIIVVASFTVIATLVMVVLDKRKEIAVMKAMGATDWAVLRIFLYQGGIIGLAGTLLGLLLGVFACKGVLVYGFPLDPKVYFISRLPVLMRLQDFMVAGEAAIVICLGATIIPSVYAADMRPAEGFRDEADASSEPRKRHWATSVVFYWVLFSSLLFATGSAMTVEFGTLPPLALVATLFFGLRAAFSLGTILWRRWALYGFVALGGLMVCASAAAVVYAHSLALAPGAFVTLGPVFLSLAIAALVVELTQLGVPLLGLRGRFRFLE